MSTLPIGDIGPMLRIGRARTWHRPRIVIEGKKVVLRTQCGLDTGEGFAETSGVATCSTCIQKWAR